MSITVRADISEVIDALGKYTGYVVATCTQFPDKITKEMEEAVKQAVLRTFKQHTGNLYRSVGREKLSDYAWMVFAGGDEAYYAIYQEYGFYHWRAKVKRLIRHPFFYNTVGDIAAKYGMTIDYSYTGAPIHGGKIPKERVGRHFGKLGFKKTKYTTLKRRYRI
mgnify:CR=1 FL=1